MLRSFAPLTESDNSPAIGFAPEKACDFVRTFNAFPAVLRATIRQFFAKPANLSQDTRVVNALLGTVGGSLHFTVGISLQLESHRRRPAKKNPVKQA